MFNFDSSTILVLIFVPFIYLFIRDVVGMFRSKKRMNKHKQELIDTEQRIMEKMDQLTKEREALKQNMQNIDQTLTDEIIKLQNEDNPQTASSKTVDPDKNE